MSADAGVDPGRALGADAAVDRLRDLLAERSFRTGEFTLSSGRTSRYYVDCRTTTMHAEGQALLGRVGLNRLEEAEMWPELVGGMTMGADPISYAVAGESWRRGSEPIHAFSVRKASKEHGRGRRIEGCFGEGRRAVVAEDVVTTGGSALEACRAVESAGGEVMAVLVLVDRQEGGRENLEEEGFPVLPLFTAGELESAL